VVFRGPVFVKSGVSESGHKMSVFWLFKKGKKCYNKAEEDRTTKFEKA